MRFQEAITLSENLSTWREAGIDQELASDLLKNYRFDHDATFTDAKKPKASEVDQGDLFALPNAVVFRKKYAGRYRNDNPFYVRYEKTDDGITTKTSKSIADAFKGLKGNWKKIDNNNWAQGDHRGGDLGGKSSAEVKALANTDPLAGSSANIWAHMQKTFMPRLQPKLEAYVDNIFANLRKLPRDADSHGVTPDKSGYFHSGQRARETAVSYANAIEDLVADGFNDDTMEKFLKEYGQLHHGYGSIPANKDELKSLLKTVPLARQKWAQMILASAKDLNDRVEQLHWQASGSAEAEGKLRGESAEIDELKKLAGI